MLKQTGVSHRPRRPGACSTPRQRHQASKHTSSLAQVSEGRLFPTRPVLTMKHDCFVYQTDASICQDRLGTNFYKEDSKKGLFSQLFLCLSRACLGKTFVFKCKWLKKEAFFFHAGYPTPQVRKRSCCEPFYTKNDHFTKPGSGQTLGKHSKKRCACFLADV
eukprot:COSAG06_NODE_1723_length_8586_cov_69.274420_6_plen_162_part_00